VLRIREGARKKGSGGDRRGAGKHKKPQTLDPFVAP